MHNRYYCSLVSLKSGKTDAPEWIQLLPFGTHAHPRGDFIFDHDAGDRVLARVKSLRNDFVVDYEHQSLEGVQAPAAGWIKEFDLRGDGLWGRVEWTGKAEGYIRNKEYKYVSPVVKVEAETSKVTEFINLALTNNPQIDGMVPLVNKKTSQKKEKNNMKAIAAALSLNESATEAEIIAAIKALKKEDKEEKDVANSAVAELKEFYAELDAKDASEAKGKLLALKQGDSSLKTLQTELTALKNGLAKEKAEKAVTEALACGKITPAQKEWATDYAMKDLVGFSAFVKHATPVIPTGDMLKNSAPHDKPNELTPERETIRRQLGITEHSTEEKE